MNTTTRAGLHFDEQDGGRVFVLYNGRMVGNISFVSGVFCYTIGCGSAAFAGRAKTKEAAKERIRNLLA